MSHPRSLLAQIDDRSIPLRLRVPVPGWAESRWQIWERLVEQHLPRDYADPLSEAKEKGEFVSEQLELLQLLSEKDYARILADDDNSSFRNVGVPGALGLRRMWMGLDPAGSLLRPVDYVSKKLKRTIQCSLWKALYLSYSVDSQLAVSRQLLGSIAPAEVLDFFYRLLTIDPFQNDLFASPIIELGRALPDKYVKEPVPEVLLWADKRAQELLAMPHEQRADYDTSLVLGVLASRLSKKEMLSDELGSLFSFKAGSWLSRQYGGLLKRIPLESQYRAVADVLSGLVRLKENPLQPVNSFDVLSDYLQTFKKKPAQLVELVLRGAQAHYDYCPQLAVQQLKRADVINWLIAATEEEGLAEVVAPHKAWIHDLASAPGRDPAIFKRPRVLVDRNTIYSLDQACRCQFRALGEQLFGLQDEADILSKTEQHRMAWLRCCTVDENEQPLVDVWTAEYSGDRIFGLMFFPSSTQSVPNIEFGKGRFVGVNQDGEQLLRRINYDQRRGERPVVLDDWSSYLATLGLRAF